MDIESKLETESIRLLDILATIDPEADEYKLVLNELSQLMGRDIEYRKLALDTEDKARANDLANRKVDLDKEDKAECRAIEERKLDHEVGKLKAETKERTEARKEDVKLRKVQMRDDRTDKILKHVTTVLIYGAGLTASILMTKVAFVYDENGAIVSPWGKKILSSWIPEWKSNKY
jgi:hypothetical protein